MEGLFVILLCQLIGQIVVRTLDLSMPAPALRYRAPACLSLVCRQESRVGKMAPPDTRVSGVADALLKNLGVLFVPLGVGVMQNLPADLRICRHDRHRRHVCVDPYDFDGDGGSFPVREQDVGRRRGWRWTLAVACSSFGSISTTSPLTWLTVTIGAYVAAQRLAALSGFNPIVNPVLIAVVLVISILTATGTSYSTYFDGAQFVHFALGPCDGGACCSPLPEPDTDPAEPRARRRRACRGQPDGDRLRHGCRHPARRT